MMSSSLIIQVLMVVVAVVIGVMYIKPTAESIKTVQDATVVYQEETQKVSSVNQLLRRHISTIESISSDNLRALDRFLPDTVDELAVLKDISTMAATVGVSLTTLDYTGQVGADGGGEILVPGGEVVPVEEYGFSVGGDMTYQEFKDLLAAIEINNYLLQINTATVEPQEDGLVTVKLELSAFGAAQPTESEDFTSDDNAF